MRGSQLGRHLVELERELADLVRGLDRHAVIELAAAETLHVQAQPLEGPGQARAQHVSRPGADQHAGRRERREEPELAADRRGHDGPRMLDDHAPADTIHAQTRRHRLDAALVRVGAGDAEWLVLVEETAHERPTDQRELLENEIRVIGGDEPAAPVDDVRAAALAEPDIGGQRPEVLEVQHTDDEQPALRGAGEPSGERHPWLGRLGGRDGAPGDAADLRHGVEGRRRVGSRARHHLAARQAVAPGARRLEDADLLEGPLARDESLPHDREAFRVAVDDGGAKQLRDRRQPFLLVGEEEVDLVPHPAGRDQLELAPGLMNVPQGAGQPDEVDAHDRDDARRRQQEEQSSAQGSETEADRGEHRHRGATRRYAPPARGA